VGDVPVLLLPSALLCRVAGVGAVFLLFFFSSRRRHTRSTRDWSSDVCSSDLVSAAGRLRGQPLLQTAVAVEPPELGVAADRRARSEERRVGKECRSRWAPDQ